MQHMMPCVMEFDRALQPHAAMRVDKYEITSLVCYIHALELHEVIHEHADDF